ncbi:MAG TPA: peptide chain release factor-like protein [Planctomycetota bacterium]|nr:peptide chain release factor-like protein [Planctomycetota bacterium]
MHPAALGAAALLRQCEQTPVRRSGPGGQHRNKASTGVVLRHRPTGVRAEANERRTRTDNLRVATERLRLNLALAVREPAAPGPSAKWVARVRGGRFALSAAHEDFPALLAEALDVLAAHEHEVIAAAPWLGVTPTQLVKLLAKEPRALAAVNEVRAMRGLRSLRA